MKILALADLHGQGVKAERNDLDLIVVAGDITAFGGYDEAREVLKPLVESKIRLIGVPGNCDYQGVADYLTEIEANIDQREIEINGFTFIGLGGSNFTPCNTPNEHTDEEFRQNLNLRTDTDKRLVLISHAPPYKTKLDRVLSGEHVGSKAVREFIEETQPILVICGHIHEAMGEDIIGNTRIINPGPGIGVIVTI